MGSIAVWCFAKRALDWDSTKVEGARVLMRLNLI